MSGFPCKYEVKRLSARTGWGMSVIEKTFGVDFFANLPKVTRGKNIGQVSWDFEVSAVMVVSGGYQFDYSMPIPYGFQTVLSTKDKILNDITRTSDSIERRRGQIVSVIVYDNKKMSFWHRPIQLEGN